MTHSLLIQFVLNLHRLPALRFLCLLSVSRSLTSHRICCEPALWQAYNRKECSLPSGSLHILPSLMIKISVPQIFSVRIFYLQSYYLWSWPVLCIMNCKINTQSQEINHLRRNLHFSLIKFGSYHCFLLLYSRCDSPILWSKINSTHPLRHHEYTKIPETIYAPSHDFLCLIQYFSSSILLKYIVVKSTLFWVNTVGSLH